MPRVRDPLALAGFALGTVLFAVCALFSFRRHVHVDELSSLYSIQLASRFARPDFAWVELNTALLGPFARAFGSSEHLLLAFRWLHLGLLYVLCLGLAYAQQALPSARGRACVFLSMVCFGPLWRHGFELRHDMYVALEIALLIWAGERARAGRLTWWVASAVGLGAIFVQGNSFKAFTIWAPGIACCALLGPRAGRSLFAHFFRQFGRFVPGLLLGALLGLGALSASGLLPGYLDQLRQYTGMSTTPPYRLSSWPLLKFTLQRAPVQAAFVLLGTLSVVTRLAKRRKLEGALLPSALFGLSLLSVLLNPTPFPYNLIWLSPAWLAMSAVGMAWAAERARHWQRPAVGSGLAAAFALLVLASFWVCQADPYYRKTWHSQLRVVAAAEALSSPEDPVIDLTGLVLSRPPPSKFWVVHSLLMDAYHAGDRETVRQMMERAWPPVVVLNYRWSWLDRADHAALRRYYVRYSDDVWTLGASFARGSSRFEVHRGGRYLARGEGSVDGQAMRSGEVLRLERGTHSVSAEAPWSLAWIGPGPPPVPPPRIFPGFENGNLPNQ